MLMVMSLISSLFARGVSGEFMCVNSNLVVHGVSGCVSCETLHKIS